MAYRFEEHARQAYTEAAYALLAPTHLLPYAYTGLPNAAIIDDALMIGGYDAPSPTHAGAAPIVVISQRPSMRLLSSVYSA